MKVDNFLNKNTLYRDQSGATAIEFALVAPLFLVLLLGTIEYGRVLWTKQVVEEVAYVTARCISVANPVCTSNIGVKQYAIAQAGERGISLLENEINSQANVLCNSYQANRIEIDYNVNSPIGKLVPMIDIIEVDACYPVQS